MNVLSLFNGASCFNLAAEKAGLKIDNVYTSEIDKYCLAVEKNRYPKNIQIGDVVNVETKYLPGIDLLVGGSPCQDFSFAGKRNGMITDENIEITDLEQYLKLKKEKFEFKGSSYLFWEFARILEEVKPKYFMLENVDRIEEKWIKVINKALGIEPININSSLVSAQNRSRLYWTNIPNVTQPKDQKIILKDVLQTKGEYIKISKKGVYKKFQDKMSCLTAGGHSGGNHSDMDLIGQKIQHIGNATDIKGMECIKRIYAEYGKMPTLTTCGGGHRQPKIALNDYEYRRLTPIEFERGQTIPDNFTEYGVFGGIVKKISNSQRYKMLGNGWTVDVIAHILKELAE